MELREVLYKGEDYQKKFIVDMKVRGLHLPEYKTFKDSKIILNKKTPYLDMIELMDLYPEFALTER